MSKMSDLHIDMQELIHLGVTPEIAREMLDEGGAEEKCPECGGTGDVHTGNDLRHICRPCAGTGITYEALDPGRIFVLQQIANGEVD